MSVDILNLEWPTSERDHHITAPICAFLSEKMGYNVVRGSMFLGRYLILRHRPKMLLISNFCGSEVNYAIAKMAYEMGIKVVSLISEGNVMEQYIDSYVWGGRTHHTMYLDAQLLWTERSRQLFLKYYPHLQDKLHVSGGVGFDRYKLLDYMSREEFLQKTDKSGFKRTVGIAGCGFFAFFGALFNAKQDDYMSGYTADEVNTYRRDFEMVSELYRQVVNANPDTLFICRVHPGNIEREIDEFKLIADSPNVFIIPPRDSGWQLADCISASDIWIGYETTTALEAWLMGKTTFLVNPVEIVSSERIVNLGSPAARNLKEIQTYLDEFFSAGQIKDFNSLQSFRDQAIREVIESADGKNHVRAAKLVNEVLLQPTRALKWSKFSLYGLVRELFKYLSVKFLGLPPHAKTILFPKHRLDWSGLYKKSIQKSKLSDENFGVLNKDL